MINFTKLYATTSKPLPVVPPRFQLVGHSYICELDCWLASDCANHTSAGDYRSEDGMTPDMIRVNEEYFCSKDEMHDSIGSLVWDAGAPDSLPTLYTGPY